jgi:two-component system, NarL family, invasion response regulator UvrY
MKRVLVADDHTAVRQGVRLLLEDLEEHLEVHEATTAEEALALVDEYAFDLVLLDLAMPGRGGMDSIKSICESTQRPPVLVLSMHPEDSVALCALRMGASGYVTKGAPRRELVRAVKDVLAGGRYVPEKLAEQILMGIDDPEKRFPHDRLSDREYRVMYLLATGKTVSEIANELDVSSKTVSTYRARVLEKLDIASTAAIVRYSLSHDLI